jgi:hypothetical protein
MEFFPPIFMFVIVDDQAIVAFGLYIILSLGGLRLQEMTSVAQI